MAHPLATSFVNNIFATPIILSPRPRNSQGHHHFHPLTHPFPFEESKTADQSARNNRDVFGAHCKAIHAARSPFRQPSAVQRLTIQAVHLMSKCAYQRPFCRVLRLFYIPAFERINVNAYVLSWPAILVRISLYAVDMILKGQAQSDFHF